MGDFIKDLRVSDYAAYCLTPFKKGFVGFQVTRFPHWQLDFYLYNGNGRKTKLLCSINKSIHTEKTLSKGPKMVFLDLLTYGPELQIYQENIYILGRDGRYIDVYNARGIKVNSIECDFKRVLITNRQKEEIWKLYKHNKEGLWQRAKKIIKVPQYFPRYRTFRITDNKIYVQTFNKIVDDTEFYVLKLNGDLIEKIKIPLIYKNIVTPYPYVIHMGRLFILKENQNTGDWELHYFNI